MTKPKLSICIPTYNRAIYLKKSLSNLVSIETFPFEWEIIISDNCSTDETPRAVAEYKEKCGRIRYLRQTRNVGAENNFNSVLRMATGDYSLYLADDDMLIPDAVVSVVRYMEQNPNIVACYASWEYWNDVAKISRGRGYCVEKEVVYEKSKLVELFDFITQRHAFPEIAVYRTSTLHKILYRPHKAYFAFVNLAKLLDCGDIAFLTDPFYRFVEVHWEGESREHFGYKQLMWDWDFFRGGLEYLLYKAFRNLGHATVPAEQRDVTQKMIDQFIIFRLSEAMRCLIAARDFISANELFLRLLSHGDIPENESAYYRQLIAPRAAAQSLIETVEAMTGLECIALYRVSDASAVETLLKEIRAGLPVRQLSDEGMHDLKDKDRMLVLVGNNEEREELLKAGYQNGLVVVEQELVSQFMP